MDSQQSVPILPTYLKLPKTYLHAFFFFRANYEASLPICATTHRPSVNTVGHCRSGFEGHSKDVDGKHVFYQKLLMFGALNVATALSSRE